MDHDQLRALSSPQISKAYNSPLRDTVKPLTLDHHRVEQAPRRWLGFYSLVIFFNWV